MSRVVVIKNAKLVLESAKNAISLSKIAQKMEKSFYKGEEIWQDIQ